MDKNNLTLVEAEIEKHKFNQHVKANTWCITDTWY